MYVFIPLCRALHFSHTSILYTVITIAAHGVLTYVVVNVEYVAVFLSGDLDTATKCSHRSELFCSENSTDRRNDHLHSASAKITHCRKKVRCVRFEV